MHNEKTTIFIDGSSGTAGLRIYDRLAQRADIDLLTLPPKLHHDIEAQRELLNRADIAFLCLPDAAAITAADLVENPDTVVLDTSTAHRTAPGWTYGCRPSARPRSVRPSASRCPAATPAASSCWSTRSSRRASCRRTRC